MLNCEDVLWQTWYGRSLRVKRKIMDKRNKTGSAKHQNQPTSEQKKKNKTEGQNSCLKKLKDTHTLSLPICSFSAASGCVYTYISL